MNKKFILAGALFAALAVIGGALGAHFLKEKLLPQHIQTFETAIRYQMYHALALIITGILYKGFAAKFLNYAGNFFIAGIILFSGSLYILCTGAALGWFGAITPLGGLCFITGWIFVILWGLKSSHK